MKRIRNQLYSIFISAYYKFLFLCLFLPLKIRISERFFFCLYWIVFHLAKNRLMIHCAERLTDEDTISQNPLT
jgi:hypothetical protein